MRRINLKKQQGGFTLVEVIVVAVIVAAMAAVAVPMFVAYVENARTNSAANAAGSVASFLGACRNTGGTPSRLGPAAVDSVPGPNVISCRTPSSPDSTTISVPAGITIKKKTAATSIVAQHVDSETESNPYSY